MQKQKAQRDLVPDEVHLWRIELDCGAASIAALQATLSPDERERAARFRTPELCERWTVAHGALRCILASYCQSEPGDLTFQAGPKGKPELASPLVNVSFNLSHTGGLALMAVAGGAQVGVDAEIIRPGIEVADLSRRFFSPAEASEILALPPEAQLAAFFACWTRKEAFVKALGAGISAPLNRFQVTVRPDQPARLLSVDCDNSDGWTLLDVGEPGVAAALAVEGRAPILHRLKFTPST